MRIIVSEEQAESYFSEFYNGIENLRITENGIEFDVDSKIPFIRKEQYIREIEGLKKAVIHMDGGLAFAHEVIAGAIQGYAEEELEDEEEDEEEDGEEDGEEGDK